MPGTVSISCLGRLGRFGNQLFQYAAARGYARKVGATLETPSWIGQTLFENVNDPPPSKSVPTTCLDEVPTNGIDTVNMYGYYQHAGAFALYTLTDLREWFKFRPWVLEEMRDYGPVPLAAHLRRGDYTTTFKSHFCTIDKQSYLYAIELQGMHNMPVTWVDEEHPTVFKRPGLEWLIDFWTLCNADIVFRANSTFSWWACTLGKARQVFSPVVEGRFGFQSLVPFVKGNLPRCTDQPNVNDYDIHA